MGYTERPIPTPKDNEVLVKLEYVGICGSDLHYYETGAIGAYVVEPPFVLGHEPGGVVVEVGKDVKHLKVGDKVALEPGKTCGQCEFCKTGRYWMCQPHDIFGFQNTNNGGMAEYVRYPKNSVLSRVPDEMSIEDALLIEPYGCSKHCVDRAQITNEDVVVISGAGTLGLGMITYARMKNPKLLIVLDMQDNRLEKAKEFGADLVFNPGKCNVGDEIRALTEGYGCDIYIEATGHPSSVVQGMDMIRKLGRFVEFSVFGAPTTLDWSIIGDRKELDVLGSHLSPYAYPFVIENITKGNLKTAGVVSRTFKLEDWETAFDYATGKYGDLKVAFVF
jgi:L-iditol 2-dehydrogenase